MHLFEVLLVFTRLGLTSFGGPIAHIGYFHNEFVLKRKWLDDESFSDLVALCQFLPGPASSQVGIAIGFSRAGYLGGVAAWIGFTLPSACLMIAFAYGVAEFSPNYESGWLHGLKVVAVAVVAHAVWNLGQKMCRGLTRLLIALIALLTALVFPTAIGQISSILIGGVLGLLLLNTSANTENETSRLRMPIGIRPALGFLALFLALIVALPMIATVLDSPGLKMFDGFFRAGSLVFGGGHVVLPMLKAEALSQGWVSADRFLAGYGAAQAMPGPLFTFAAYLGAVSSVLPSGIWGGVICLFAIFLPSFLLIFGALPFWDSLKRLPRMRTIFSGVNAAVVGLLAAALYNPVWISAIHHPIDFAVAAFFFLLLTFTKLPPLFVVISGMGVFTILSGHPYL